MTERVFLGLGSNSGNSLNILCEAVRFIHTEIGSVIALSPLYRSAPVGPVAQNDFLNAVLCVTTAFNPIALLDHTQHLEKMKGRERLIHWGPRTLDIDILMYGHLQINLPRLIIPHPEMRHRHFVLRPLKDIETQLGTVIWPDLDQHLSLVAHQKLHCQQEHWCTLD